MSQDDIQKLVYKLADITQNMPNSIGTIAGFYKNYKDMENTPWYDDKDKYFHSKANFNAGRHYNFLPAVMFDVGKELYDIPKKIWIKPNGLGYSKNFKDSIKDLNADFYGLYQGATHPLGNPQILLDDYRPKQLDPRY